jgi:hypothetical protein
VSKGTAHIVFERPADALEAYKAYNSVALDGKKINIEVGGGEGLVQGGVMMRPSVAAGETAAAVMQNR